MALWIDHKYISLLGPYLEQFSKKDTNLYNFRCPLCGDSSKNKRKARGYIYLHPKSNSLKYKCHNCQRSMSIGNLIQYVNPSLYKEYRFELYTEGQEDKKNQHVFNNPKPVTKPQRPNFMKHKLGLKYLVELPENHPVIEYARSRQIPDIYFSELMAIEDSSLLEQVNEKYKDRIKDDSPRLVFECKNKDNLVIGYVARAIYDHALRYVTVKIEGEMPLIYGLSKIKEDKRLFVVEGPLDSLFLPNCIAAGTSNLIRVDEYVDNEEQVYIFDNQPRNRDVIAQMNKASKAGKSVVVWPENIEQKDINQMINEGYTKRDILNIINTRTFEGMRYEVEMTQWKKI